MVQASRLRYSGGREDGFEINHIMLIKDTSNNTRICSPHRISDVRCIDYVEDDSDNIGNIAVTLESAVVVLDLSEELEVSTLPDNCTGTTSIRCSIGDVETDGEFNLVIGFESELATIHTVNMTTQAATLEEGSVSSLLSLTVLPVEEAEEVEEVIEEPAPVPTPANERTEDSKPVSQGGTTGALGGFSVFLLLSALLVRARRVSARLL